MRRHSPPPVECERCESEIPITERLIGLDGDRVCKECATEEELDAWNDYVGEQEAKATAAQKRGIYGR